MKRLIPLLATALAALLVGFVAGWLRANSVGTDRLDRMIAMSWGDGKYGPAFYGARVYLEPESDGYSVKALVQIARGSPYFHDLGELGKVRTDAEAVARWGRIEWREDGLHIGNEPDHLFFPRASLERHR